MTKTRMPRHSLTDAQWELIADLFPVGNFKTGRRPRDRRVILNAILWVLRTGARWRDVPTEYGPWSTAWNFFDAWTKDGTFDAMLQRLRGLEPIPIIAGPRPRSRARARGRTRTNETSAAHLGQHGDDANEKLFGIIEFGGRVDIHEGQDIDNRTTFHSGPTSDGMEPRAIRRRYLAGALSNVERDRKCGTTQLVTQLSLAPGHAIKHLEHEGNKTNSALIDVESFMIQHHGRLSEHRRRKLRVSPTPRKCRRSDAD